MKCLCFSVKFFHSSENSFWMVLEGFIGELRGREEGREAWRGGEKCGVKIRPGGAEFGWVEFGGR